MKSIEELYRIITEKLIASGLTITTMESITSGFLASLITDTEGSSAVMKGAFVTYSNEAKIRQGVPAETIERYGVYSKETAKAMAEAAAAAYEADIAIGVTGSAGNVDPNNADSVPGHVCYAIRFREQARRDRLIQGELLSSDERMAVPADRVFSDAFDMPILSSRRGYKEYIARVIGEKLLTFLK